MKHRSTLVSATLVVLLATVSLIDAQQPQPSRVPTASRYILATLSVGADGHVAFNSANVMSGKLQHERGTAARSEFTAVLEDARGTSLGAVGFDDPTKLRAEWSPDRRRIARENVQLASTSVVVRLPYREDARRLRILRADPDVQTASKRAGIPTGAPVRSVAVFDLDLAAPSALPPPSYTTETIVDNGPAEKRLDIVFLGDGYTASQLGKFHSDVLNVVDEFLAASPYDGFMPLINIHLVNVVSNQSGIDDPEAGVSRDTALDLSFNIGGTQRCVYTQSAYKVYAAAALVPQYDRIFVIANDPQYGGCGGDFACFTTDPTAGEIAIHEFGHSFGLLADEYGGNGQAPEEEPDRANVTIARSLSGLASAGKWDYWVPSGQHIPTSEGTSGVGLFEGAVYADHGAYRPVDNCRMRVLGVPYCPICLEQLTRRLHAFADPIDEFSTTPAPSQSGPRTVVSMDSPAGNAPSPDLDVRHIEFTQTENALRLSMRLEGPVTDTQSDSGPYYVFSLVNGTQTTNVYVIASSRRIIFTNDSIPYEDLGVADFGDSSVTASVPLDRFGNPDAMSWSVFTVDGNDDVAEHLEGSEFSLTPLNQVILQANDAFNGEGAPLTASGATYALRWLVDGNIVSTTGSFSSTASALGPGLHAVRFEVSATTPLVRRDPEHLLDSVRELAVAVCGTGPRISKVKFTLDADGKVKLTGAKFKVGTRVQVNGLELVGAGQVKKQGKVYLQSGPLSNGLPLSSVLTSGMPATILAITATGDCSSATATP